MSEVMNRPSPGFLSRIPSLRVLVIGDFMLDHYVVGTTERVSPEAPVPVVRIEQEYRRLGGAGNVVSNLRSLGCAVYAAGVIGRDPAAEQVRAMCREVAVDSGGLLEDPARSTTEKVRVIAQNQQLIRYDREKTNFISPALSEQLTAHVDTLLNTSDLVVLSDYAKGTLRPDLIARIATMARARRLAVIGDPKGSDYSRYYGVTALTPNEREFWQAAGEGAREGGDLVQSARLMLQTLDLGALCITRGARGVTLVLPDSAVEISANVVEVYDVTGAGDTFVSVFGACLAAGGSYPEAAQWANRAAGIAVSRLGATSVGLVDLLLIGAWREKVLPLREIELIAMRLREAGKRIVFTNGCFDLLHAGHIQTLERAESFGDVLIVGLNSDASVKRLKGPGRPFIQQGDRARLLASFGCVDYVVVFEEDTPETLIKCVRPDVVVKGADYRLDQVVGREFVESYGGRVELIDLVADVSTTSLIERIRNSVA